MNELKGIGIMSGSSLDVLDISFCEYRLLDSKWDFTFLIGETIPFDLDIFEGLQNARQLSGLALTELDIQLGIWIGRTVQDFCTRHQIDPDIIGSHGHTVFHQPAGQYSLQIGNGQAIATHASIPTICNFRSKDVIYGGAGAPLVPIGDLALFSEYDVLVNLGGIANLTIKNGVEIKAFDIAPCNQVLNKIANLVGLTYDHDGALALSGSMLNSWYEALSAIPYFKLKGPKSMSNEWVAEEIIAKLPNFAPKDMAYTFCQFVGGQLSQQLADSQYEKILITGGGAYNKGLVKAIEDSLGRNVIIPSPNIIDFKEAIIFGFMAILKQRNETNVLKIVTGASRDTSAGILYLP